MLSCFIFSPSFKIVKAYLVQVWIREPRRFAVSRSYRPRFISLLFASAADDSYVGLDVVIFPGKDK